MPLGSIEIFLAMLLAAGAGFLVGWLIRRESMERSATYASSLEQVLAGTMREREAALERERVRKQELGNTIEALNARLLEIEKELAHRETQVVAFRDEALSLARTREELLQRLGWQEQQAREAEASLRAHIKELEDGAAARGPGQRTTGAERELAALVAAHETDLAELEARYLELLQSKNAEIDRLQAVRVGKAGSAPAAAPAAEDAAAGAAESTAAEPATPSAGNGTGSPSSHAPRSRRTRRRRSRDDLKQIAGIDESLEQALHLVGVTSFRQVARWKDKDIDRMAKKLYQSPERIRDEQWVERARDAYARKYGTTP